MGPWPSSTTPATRCRPAPSGRIFVGGGVQFSGYTGGGTKDRVDGLMSTGDVGRFDDDGLLFVTGRYDDMIVSGGENVFPGEVEDLLVANPGILDAAASAWTTTSSDSACVPFVVPAGSHKPTEDELKAHVKANLANYKVPRETWFLDELPRNATGKVLKRELKEIEQQPK